MNVDFEWATSRPPNSNFINYSFHLNKFFSLRLVLVVKCFFYKKKVILDLQILFKQFKVVFLFGNEMIKRLRQKYKGQPYAKVSNLENQAEPARRNKWKSFREKMDLFQSFQAEEDPPGSAFLFASKQSVVIHAARSNL